MILPTMTPKEKVAQIEKLRPYIVSIARKAASSKISVLKKATRFPAFVFLTETDITGFGKWTVVLGATSKKDASRGSLWVRAFQTYYIPRAKNPSNIGYGIYMAMPKDDTDKSTCYDYSPHYFNRFRDRYVNQKGIAQLDFRNLIKELFRVQFDSMQVVLTEDFLDENVELGSRYKKQEDSDNFIIYHKQGISFGVTKDGCYNYITYVSNELLKENQIMVQDKLQKKLLFHKLNMRYGGGEYAEYEEDIGGLI